MDSRFVDSPDYSYSYFRVTIAKLNDNNTYQFVDSILSPERNIFIESVLEPGLYVALVEFYNSGNVRDYNVGTYSEEQIGL